MWNHSSERRYSVWIFLLLGEAWCIIYFKEKELDSKLEIMTHSAITVLEEAAETPNVIVEVIE